MFSNRKGMKKLHCRSVFHEVSKNISFHALQEDSNFIPSEKEEFQVGDVGEDSVKTHGGDVGSGE